MNATPADVLSLPPHQQALRDRCFHPTERFVEFGREAVEQSIPERFEDQVRAHAHRPAVKTQGECLTYRELNAAANRIAHAILCRRGEDAENVALLLCHGAAAIAAVLGTLKAGKAYVPLDGGAPAARNRHIVEHAQARMIVTDDPNAAHAAVLAGAAIPVLNVDRLASAAPCDNPALRMSPDRLSYLIYTSGSTGVPKGVAQNHRNVLFRTMGWVNAVHVSPGDRVSLLRSISVSGSIRDLFGGLLCGATVMPFDVKSSGPAGLAAFLDAEGITLFSPVVSLLRSLGATLARGEKLSSVRLLKLSGEPVQRRDVETYKRHFSDRCVLVNVLACTEVGSTRVYFMDHASSIEERFVPVGYPLEGCEVLLLDAEGNRLGFDAEGEIAVRSRFLAPGYWRNPELTAAVFSPDPDGSDARVFRTGDLGCMRPDGCLLHRGRKDAHVKIRGYSVELAEVEAALSALDSVEQAVVTARSDGHGDAALVAYVIAAEGAPPTASRLRGALAGKLPDYMMPTAFVFMRSFPLIGPGKVDLRALPEPGRSRPPQDVALVLPRSPTEAALAGIWRSILALDQIGVEDRFLDLGGNSLSAARLLARVEEAFGIELPMRSFFDAPTVAAMATLVERHRR